MKLYLDLETYSPTPLASAGVYRYAEQSEILIFAYALDDGPVRVHDCTSGNGCLPLLLDDPRITEIYAHNANFDRVILEHHNLIEPLDPRWRCTMVRALAHGLPGGLLMLSELLKLPIDKAKDKAGHALILLFCKPRPDGSRATAQTHPEHWARFLDYAKLDIEALRELDKKLPRWNEIPVERETWLLDQKINDRGIQIDTDLAEAAVKAVAAEKRQRDRQMQKDTGGDVGTAKQVKALIVHIQEVYGITMPDLQKATVERRLMDPELPETVKDLLRARLVGSGTAVAKYNAMLKSVCKDGRVRGTLQFCGASRSGRWGGRLIQVQNFPRPEFKADVIEQGIDALKAGCADLVYDNVSAMASSAIRGAIIAPRGKKLVVSDLSAIEGRVLAWLAGEKYKLENYRAYDRGEGYDTYVSTYATTFNVQPCTVSKEQRSLGKVIELFSGYGGGVGAFLAFANGYGIDLDELARDTLLILPNDHKYGAMQWYDKCKAEGRDMHGLSKAAFVTCDAIKRMWRAANPNTVAFWYAAENAAKTVLTGAAREVKLNKGLIVRRVKNWLLIQLPSGRSICYASARVDSSGIVYRGVDTYTKKWQDIRTYSGKLCILHDTNVLTDVGWLPIQDVTNAHLVWDGIEWVKQSGAICQGVKPIIYAHGVGMTEDHFILTNKGWVHASQSGRYHRAPCRLPDSDTISGVGRKKVAMVGSVRLWKRKDNGSLRVKAAKKEGYPRFLRLYARENRIGKTHNPRHVKASSIRGLAKYARALPAGISLCMEKLRRQGYLRMQTLAEKFQKFLGGYGVLLRARFVLGSYQQQWKLHPAQLPMGHVQRAGEKHEEHKKHRHPLRSDERRSPGRKNGDREYNDSLSVVDWMQGRAAYRETQPREKVYDLIDCGPRHRFVVQSDDGRPLIVHNCENITQAVARDILTHGMLLAEDVGYQTVMSVHDELVTETPDRAEYSAVGLSTLMSMTPKWAPDLPLAAAGFEAYRYRKD